MPRLSPITSKDQVPPGYHDVIDTVTATIGNVRGPFTMVLHSPDFARVWSRQSAFFRTGSVVRDRVRELAILAVARERDCLFAWADHVGPARAAGITDDVIAALRGGQDPAGLAPEDADVVAYARALLRTNRVPRALFDRLIAWHDARWLVELTGLVGRYEMVGGVLNTFEVTPALGTDALPVPGKASGGAAPATASPGGPRIPPITSKDQVAPEHRTIFDAVAEGRGSVRGPFSILIYSPPLCQGVLDQGTFLRFQSLVKPTEGELAICAVAREKDCPYVWAAHVTGARKAGVREEAIAAVRNRRDVSGLKSDDRALVSFVRQLLRTNRVESQVFDALEDRYGAPWLVELTGIVGHYSLVTNVLNAFEVAPAPEADQLPLGV